MAPDPNPRPTPPAAGAPPDATTEPHPIPSDAGTPPSDAPDPHPHPQATPRVAVDAAIDSPGPDMAQAAAGAPPADTSGPRSLSPPARTAAADAAPPADAASGAERYISLRRDRLLAALTLMAGVGLLVGVPFALQAGSSFFLPLTAAFVIAIALVPALEWLQRRRLPAPLAALICVLGFLVVANVALASIVVPAIEWFRVLPERINRIQSNLAPLLDLYSSLNRFLNETIAQFAQGSRVRQAQTAAVEPPGSLVEVFATSAPTAIIEMFFALLVIYFFLSGWTALRQRTITSRQSFGGAMATARVIQDVVDDTSSYLGTITFINVGLGAIVAWGLWMMGMPSPLMWGGIVALLNFVPYLGPILAALLLALGGLMTFADIWMAMAPAVLMTGAHLVEANVITPLIVGKRLTINPILILISLSFWGWVWGAPGALLAVPLLIIIQTIVRAAGKPDIAGFLFEHGTLTGPADPSSR